MGVYTIDEDKGASGMSRSKLSTSSSSSRLVGMPKRLWKSRAKSQSRLASTTPCTWSPEGNCRWKTSSGHSVVLSSTNLMNLTEIERQSLQQLALLKLQDLSLGCRIEIPKGDSAVCQKVKRRPMLLKKKAATTGLLEGKDRKDKDISSHGQVFGIPLTQCIRNDRLSRQRSCGLLRERAEKTDDFGDQNTGSSSRMDEELSSRGPHSDTVSETSLCSLGDPRGDGRSSGKKTPEDGSMESLSQLFCSRGERLSVSSMPDRWTRGSTESVFGRGPLVPNVVNTCFKHIETYGLHTLGIFRVSSSRKRVRQLREDFDTGKDVKLNEEHHPHDVAELLKEYFRDLPEPLLTRELYYPFLNTQRMRDPTKQIEALRWLVYLLPIHNRDTLWALLEFLSKVADHATDTKSKTGDWLPGNKMDTSNLATLFGPNILRATRTGKDCDFLVESFKKVQDHCDVILAISSLISQYEKLFQVPAEVLDAVYRRLLIEDPEALDILLRRCLYIEAELSGIIPEDPPPVLEEEEPKAPERSRKKDKKSASDIFERAGPLSLSGPDVKGQFRRSPYDDTRPHPSHTNVSTTRSAHSTSVDARTSSPTAQSTERDNCVPEISATFTVRVPMSLEQRTKSPQRLPRLTISEADSSADHQEKNKGHRVRYGRHKNLTSPTYHISEMKEEMSITVTIPQGKTSQEKSVKTSSKKPESKSIEKSASTSVLFANFFLRDKKAKDKQHKEKSSKYLMVDDADKNSGTNYSSRRDSSSRRPSNISNQDSNKSSRKCSRESTKFPQERWKRWEIIASEHTEH